MNEDLVLKKNSIRFWYYRYKDSPYFSLSIITVTILVCVILLIQIVIPEAEKWFSIRNEVIATRERIGVLRANQNFMNNLDRSVINAQMQIASEALPPEKNFDSILNAITESALLAGVPLGDFSFQVGDISSASGQIADPAQHGMTAVDITLQLGSNMEGTKRFLKEVREKLPLSEVTHVDGSQQSTAVTMRFYQKSFPNVSIDRTKPITPVSDNTRALLQQLSSWQPAPVQSLSNPSGSSSGSVPLF